MSNNKLSANSLALIALTNEYCQAIEQAAQMNRDALVARMLQLLPRIYITVSDIDQEYGYSDYYIDGALDEMAYDQARDMLAAIMAGRSLRDAVEFAGSFVRDAMQITCEQPDFEVRGVSFETQLGKVAALLG